MADFPFVTSLDENGNPLKDEAPPLVGLGGWLALLGASLVLGLLFKAYGLFQVIALISGPAWEQLTYAPYASYDPLWRPFILFDLSAIVLLSSLNAVVLYFFFMKKKSFVPTFVVYVMACLAAGTVDAFFLTSIGNAVRNAFNIAIFQLFIMAGHALIWWPYLKVSVRAKNTFTN